MSFLSSLFGVVKKIVPLLQKGIDLAKDAGVTEVTVQQALKLVKTASTKFVDNDQRRDWVIKVLMDHKIPESIARILTELAFQLFKKEVSDRLDAELAKQKAAEGGQ